MAVVGLSGKMIPGLGKTRYPATFFQTHEGQAWKTEIPFDLVVDFVPELLHSPDLSLQHLAARSPQEIPGFGRIAGNSRTIRLAVGRAQKAAVRDVPVLILGETHLRHLKIPTCCS